MAKLTLDIKTNLPSEEKVLELAHELENEMHGRPLSAESASEFTEELKRRIFALVEIKISHPSLKGF